MILYPGVEIKPVKGNTLLTDGNFHQVGAHLGIKAVAIHAKIKRRIAQPDEARQTSMLNGHMCRSRL